MVLNSTEYTVQYNSSTMHPRTLWFYTEQSTQYSIGVVQCIPGRYGSKQYTVQSTVQQQYNPSQDIIVLYRTQYTVQYSSSTIHPRTLQSYTEHSTQYSIGVVQCIPGRYNSIQYTVQYSSSTMHPRTLQFYTIHSTVQQQYNASPDIIVLYSTQYT